MLKAGRTVAVVGAAGFLGRATVAALARAGHRVIGVDVAPRPENGPADWHVADVALNGLPEAALAADVLIHLAWRNDPGRGNADMLGDLAGNVAGAVRVFEQASRAGVRRILYASSGGTLYGRAPIPTREDAPMAPIGGYGAGKAAAELYLNACHHAFGVQTCVLRIANPYGPGQYPNRGQGFIATAIARTLARQPIEVFGTLSLSRDYVFVDDVAQAMALAAGDDSDQLVLNVASGQGRSLADLIDLIFAIVGHDTEVVTTAARAVDVPRMALDIGRIQATLGWRPTTPIEDGLRAAVDWIRALET